MSPWPKAMRSCRARSRSVGSRTTGNHHAVPSSGPPTISAASTAVTARMKSMLPRGVVSAATVSLPTLRSPLMSLVLE
jgi:hypothetical protein